MNCSRERGFGARLLVTIVVFCLAAAGPLAAAPPGSTLSGVIRSGSGNAPLVGVRVFAGDPATGEVYRSAPTEEDGTFAIADLPPASYRIAVESNAGLYLVDQPVPLAAGSNPALGISVDPSMRAAADDDPEGGEGEDDGDDDPAGTGKVRAGKRPQIWNNPFTASMLVLGLAVIFGLVIENATDDSDGLSEQTATPVDIEQ